MPRNVKCLVLPQRHRHAGQPPPFGPIPHFLIRSHSLTHSLADSYLQPPSHPASTDPTALRITSPTEAPSTLGGDPVHIEPLLRPAEGGTHRHNHCTTQTPSLPPPPSPSPPASHVTPAQCRTSVKQVIQDSIYTPPPLDNLAYVPRTPDEIVRSLSRVRKAVTEAGRRGERGLNQAVERWIGVEESLKGWSGRFLVEEERTWMRTVVTPFVAGIGGSFAARNRVLPIRLVTPPLVFVTFWAMVNPRSTVRVFDTFRHQTFSKDVNDRISRAQQGLQNVSDKGVSDVLHHTKDYAEKIWKKYIGS